MKKSLKKATALLVVLVLVLTTLLISPFSAYAVETVLELEGSSIAIWADPENVLSQNNIAEFSTNKLATLGGIKPYKRSSGSTKYYLFLPSTADCSALKFWFEGTASINGTPITSGEPTNVFASINEGGVSQVSTFTLNSTDYSVTVLKSGDVGTVYIDTNSGSIKTITDKEHTGEEGGTIMVVRPNGTVDYMGVMEKMSGRGNGTWSSTGIKNPYNIKLQKSTSLLGMASAKKWCLLANSGDTSLVKNQITYDFAKYIGIKYQPVCKPVDLYVNQQYLGSYQLSEKVEIKSNRINISDAYENLEIANGTADPVTGAIIPANLTGTAVTTYNPNTLGLNTTNVSDHTVTAKKYSPSLKEPSDYTGGYLYELEISNRWVEENAGFCAYNRQGWVIKNANYASTNMVDYSYNLLYALGSSVYNKGIVPSTSTTTSCNSANSRVGLTPIPGDKSITNPAPAAEYQGKKWSDILDADSAVRYYWTQEFFKNMDASTSSTYFHKDADAVDSKLYAGPVWDMDNSCGECSDSSRWGISLTSTTDWYVKNSRIYRWRSTDSTKTYSKDTQSPLNFYAALSTNCTDFWSMAEKYWYSYISPAVDILSGKTVDETGVLKSVSEYINTVAKSGTMNNLRYNLDNDGVFNTAYHIDRLSNWFNDRQTWIDTQISKEALNNVKFDVIRDQVYTGSEITPKTTVKLTTNRSGVTETVTLEEGVDFTYSYSNNINTGTATLTVTGCGLYTGQNSTLFKIVPAALNNFTLSIDSAAYSDMVLSAVIADANGNELGGGVSYQWYRNGTAIGGATGKEYTTTAEDVGSKITVTATGDGTNVTGNITSNECDILTGTRPEGYTRTIASWDYDYTADNTLLNTADSTGAEYYYLATSGENQSTSTLRASVNAKDYAKIKWSGSADLYKNDSTMLASDQTPVMGTSKTDALAWGTYPYFETTLSTAGYENITFSAKLGGSKKAPRDWKLQYSLDGVNYTDVEGAAYSITANKSMEAAFNEVALPSACNNQRTLYIRVVVANDIAINGTNTIVNQVSGDAAVNNIKINGSSLKVVTSLYEPTITPDNGSVLYDDTLVQITDNNGGANVYYTVNDSEPMLYAGPFCPFDIKTAKLGDAVTITAYSQFNDVFSEQVTSSYTFGGVDISSFSYNSYSSDVTAGAVASVGGAYGESGRMTAYTDGKSQYVPLWNDGNKAFSIAPDDGAKWSKESGFTYKVSTAGYKNINFSCMAYTTLQGPNSITLQYSTNGIDFVNVKSNVVLSANMQLEQVFVNTVLPSVCDNCNVLYIRLVTDENLTNEGKELHNNASKGNLYVNNTIIAGEDDGTYKMPYTNKSTDYFGMTGTVKYYSPDNMPMTYIVTDPSGTIVQSGTYPITGIQLSTVDGFKANEQKGYTISIYVVEDEESSLINTRTYYYKGDTVVKFNYNSTTKLFNNYVSSDFKSVASTSGANSGTLSMYPNALESAILSYTGTYGVKVSWDALNAFYANKELDNPDDNGYWLIETSTKGYRNLTLNLEQLSSNSGPRDWGIAYSTDGNKYTYVENSNARAISNDAVKSTVETYGNLVLPSECDNQEKLYIKVFINGGESVTGSELELITKGNTGINSIELSGIAIQREIEIKTTVLENPDDTAGTIAWSNVNVAVDGVDTCVTDVNGIASIMAEPGSTHEITLSGDGIITRTYTITVDGNVAINAPLLVFDVNGDGYVNAKDYAIISKDSKYSGIKELFKNFINFETAGFLYK